MKNEHSKPPMGVAPQWVVASQRASELAAAIERYTTAGLLKENAKLVNDWTKELHQITNRAANN